MHELNLSYEPMELVCEVAEGQQTIKEGRARAVVHERQWTKRPQRLAIRSPLAADPRQGFRHYQSMVARRSTNRGYTPTGQEPVRIRLKRD